MYLFYVQGGGLGHLTRVDKVIKALDIPVSEIIIITPSVFTRYFCTYKFITLLWDENPAIWSATISKTIAEFDINSLYIDTFPYGLKSELTPVFKTFPNLKLIYISRVLKWHHYLEAMLDVIPIYFSETLVLETLYEDHLLWINSYSEKIISLQLPPSVMASIFLDVKKPFVLIVHSGGEADVLKICNRAIKDYEILPEVTFYVFTQVALILNNPRVIVKTDIFPASQYFDTAEKIYTAAGFNSIMELKRYKSKHVVMPLEKLYDDQFFRYLKSR